MKGTLKLENGREITVEIDDKTLKSIEEPKKTGYERVGYHEDYIIVEADNDLAKYHDDSDFDDNLYNIANYYSDETIAENNARADTLMRKLRRFAVEHREKEIDWNDDCFKYYFFYDYNLGRFITDSYINCRDYGTIYFDTRDTAEKAIEEFKDELIWYFTEYKDSL